MNPIDVSIILPVYNVSKYLERCFTSIINQTHPNFEVIIVNDGSTDNSGVICDQWALKDSRINVLHQSNSGVAAARNRGITGASGTYVFFMDPDDWIEPNLIADNLLESNKSDIVIFGYQKETITDSGVQKTDSKIKPAALLSQQEIIKGLVDVLENGGRFSVWNKLFKTELIRKNSLQFPAFKRGQDIAFTLRAFKHANSIVTNPKIYYHQIAFNTADKYNPDAIENHFYFTTEFYHLFNDWMLERRNLNYLIKLLSLWFFHVVPSNIVANVNLSYHDKKKLLKSMVNHETMKQILNGIPLNSVKQLPLRFAIGILKSKNVALLYMLTKLKSTLINNLNSSFFKTVYNRQG